MILASLKSAQKYRFGISAEELHTKLVEGNHYIKPKKALEILNSDADSYLFVDLRNPRDFDNYHIEGAVNVPLQRVLDEEYESALKDDRKKILYSDESIKANEIWMVLSQYGYGELFVLEGGLNYWQKNILNNNVFNTTGTFSDEKAKYDFKKVIAGEEK